MNHSVVIYIFHVVEMFLLPLSCRTSLEAQLESLVKHNKRVGREVNQLWNSAMRAAGVAVEAPSLKELQRKQRIRGVEELAGAEEDEEEESDVGNEASNSKVAELVLEALQVNCDRESSRLAAHQELQASLDDLSVARLAKEEAVRPSSVKRSAVKSAKAKRLRKKAREESRRGGKVSPGKEVLSSLDLIEQDSRAQERRRKRKAVTSDVDELSSLGVGDTDDLNSVSTPVMITGDEWLTDQQKDSASQRSLRPEDSVARTEDSADKDHQGSVHSVRGTFRYSSDSTPLGPEEQEIMEELERAIAMATSQDTDVSGALVDDPSAQHEVEPIDTEELREEINKSEGSKKSTSEDVDAEEVPEDHELRDQEHSGEVRYDDLEYRDQPMEVEDLLDEVEVEEDGGDLMGRQPEADDGDSLAQEIMDEFGEDDSADAEYAPSAVDEAVASWLSPEVNAEVERRRLLAMQTTRRTTLLAGFEAIRACSSSAISSKLQAAAREKSLLLTFVRWDLAFRGVKAWRRWKVLIYVAVLGFLPKLARIRHEKRLKQRKLIISTHSEKVLRTRAHRFLGHWYWWARRNRRCWMALEDINIRTKYFTLTRWKQAFRLKRKRKLKAVFMLQHFISGMRRQWIVKATRAKVVIVRFLRTMLARRKSELLRRYRRREEELKRCIPARMEWKQRKNCWKFWKGLYRRKVLLRRMLGRHVAKRLQFYVTKWKTQISLFRSRLHKKATILQSVVRMSIVKRKILNFYRWRRGLLQLQARVRASRARSHYQVKLRYHYACVAIAKFYRGYCVRRRLFRDRVRDIHYAAEFNSYERLQYYCDRYPNLLFEYDENGNTALHNACKAASRRTVKLLLKMNLDPNAVNSAGYTPLHVLITSNSLGRDKLCPYVIERGFDEDALTPDGKTCLMLACEYGRDALVEYFLSQQQDPMIPDFNGTTCLQLACIWGFGNIVKSLLSHGADPNRAGYGGSSPLHDVTQCGDIDIASTLLAYGAYINSVDYNQQTPLMWACQAGSEGLTRFYLLEGQADSVAVDLSGRQAIHFAAMCDNPAVLEALREADANFDSIDSNGDTPLHIAAEYGNVNMIKALLQVQ